MNHLDALQLRLSNERMRLADAKTNYERRLRSVWVRQIEKEIEHEVKYEQISIDELAEELKDFK
jgi:hypothetical protein